MKSIWELDWKNIISPKIKQLQQDTVGAFAKMESAEKVFANSMQHASDGMRDQVNVIGGLRQAAMEFFAIDKFYQMGQSIFDTGSKMEVLRVQFQTLTGSVETGNAAFETLTQLYKEFPILGKENIISASKQLLEIGVPVDQISKKIYQLGSIAGGSSESLGELTTAYERAVALGSVQTRMLLHQPVLLQEIGRMYHMSSIALRKFINEGNITLPVLEKALNNLTGAGGRFHGMLESLNDTMAGRIAQFKENFVELGEKIFIAIEPAAKSLLRIATTYLPTIENGLKDIWHIAKSVFGFFREHQFLFYVMAGGIAAMISPIPTLLQGLYAIATAETIMDLLNPFMLIAVAIGVVIAAVIYCWNKFEGFRKFMYSLYETVKVVFTGIATVIYTAIKGVAEVWEGVFSLDFGLIKKGLTDMYVNTAKAAYSALAGTGAAWQKGQQEGKDAKITNPLDTHSLFKNSLAGNPPSGASPATEAASGGAQGKNIIIHKIEQKVTINCQEAKDGIVDAVTFLRKGLLSVVNDVQTAL